MVCWNSVSKIRLSLTKASFIYTKAEEGSGRKNYVIFITKIDHTIVEPIWRTSFDIYICKTKLICKIKFTCKTKLYFDYLSNLRVFVLQKPPKDVSFFSKKLHTICFGDLEILILFSVYTDWVHSWVIADAVQSLSLACSKTQTKSAYSLSISIIIIIPETVNR